MATPVSSPFLHDQRQRTPLVRVSSPAFPRPNYRPEPPIEEVAGDDAPRSVATFAA